MYNASITRRDYIGATLVGSGAALLAAKAPAFIGAAHAQSLSDAWTGPGGVGDYARSNGNTHAVVNAAHGVRDGRYSDAPLNANETDEEYDTVIVGGGFAGLGAAFTFMKESNGAKHCLILDNHPVFGGEAKQNEFDVDGYRLIGPQGSNGFGAAAPSGPIEMQYVPDIWHELGIPSSYEFEPLTGTDKQIRFGADNYGVLLKFAHQASIGYFYGNSVNGDPWRINAQTNRFRDAPIPDTLKRQLNRILDNSFTVSIPDEKLETWLDSMTYKQFLVDTLGLSADVCGYLDPYLATSISGMGSDVTSAYAAYAISMPGVAALLQKPQKEALKKGWRYLSFPGGNAVPLRYLVKAVIPEAISGGDTLEDIQYGSINFSALDRPGASVRMRLSSTVVQVQHQGRPEGAKSVRIVYVKDGRLYSVRAKTVIIAAGGWVARRIISDLPGEFRQAYAEFHHAPILVVNVALRHWRFMEKLGISAARWFDGFGWAANIRQPMKIGKYSQPLNPDKPAVLTLYAPFLDYAGRSLLEQTILARNELFSHSFADYELKIRALLLQLFSAHGFDADRDIAGIVLNRWGHAYISPQPGFFFGKNGGKAPREIIQEGYGRLSFGHSELTGIQYWFHAFQEGERAARQALAKL